MPLVFYATYKNSEFGKSSYWEDFELVGLVSGSNFTINQCMYNPITRLVVIKSFWNGNGAPDGTAFARVPENINQIKHFLGHCIGLIMMLNHEPTW